MTGSGLLEAHQEFPEAIQPGLCPLDDPPPGAPVRVPSPGLGLRAALRNMRHIPAGPHRVVCRLAGVAFDAAEVLPARLRGGTRDDDPIQRGLQEGHIMPVGAAHD